MGSDDPGGTSFKGKFKTDSDDLRENENHQEPEGSEFLSGICLPDSISDPKGSIHRDSQSGDRDFLPESKTGFGSESPPRSSPKGEGHPKRQAGPRDPQFLEAGQGESSFEDSSESATRRLWIAVLIQGIKDVCSRDERSSMEALTWSKSSDFESLCRIIGIDISKGRMVFRSLRMLEPDVRHKMIGGVVQQVVGSPGRGEKTGPSDEEPVGG